ncbi:MAG: nucleotidyltransferase family protein [Deltaproteobacteria bacterium]|nr:nucleotidyltransferase family protein [Deltaproteobacteria bacterium]
MTKDTLAQLTVSLSATLRDVLRTLSERKLRVALVVEDTRFVGVMTDTQLHEILLGDYSLDHPLAEFVDRSCLRVSPEADRAEAVDLMQSRGLMALPIVTSDEQLVGVHLQHAMVGVLPRNNWAVVMCGGRGARLGPLTDTLPKPMLPVAGKPILERIVLLLASHGIRRIYLAVHYLGSVIESHFGDGSRLGVDIRYLREETPLGTGGALALLPEPPVAPLVVMNGDLITQARIGDMLDEHQRSGAAATLGVRRYLHVVPFGCVEVRDSRVVQMEEKPALSKLVNTGVYVLEPHVVARVPKAQEHALPALLEECLQNNERVQSFEIVDDWIDVGQRERLLHARGETNHR